MNSLPPGIHFFQLLHNSRDIFAQIGQNHHVKMAYGYVKYEKLLNENSF